LEAIAEHITEPEETWAMFKAKADLLKKENVVLSKKIIKLNVFPESALLELEG
jgi:hypothetical protein